MPPPLSGATRTELLVDAPTVRWVIEQGGGRSHVGRHGSWNFRDSVRGADRSSRLWSVLVAVGEHRGNGGVSAARRLGSAVMKRRSVLASIALGAASAVGAAHLGCGGKAPIEDASLTTTAREQISGRMRRRCDDGLVTTDLGAVNAPASGAPERATVRVRVESEESGEPLEGAVVSVSAQEVRVYGFGAQSPTSAWSLIATSSFATTGGVALIPAVDTGIVVTARAAGRVSRSVLVPAQTSGVILALPRGRDVFVRLVAEESGAPLQGVLWAHELRGLGATDVTQSVEIDQSGEGRVAIPESPLDRVWMTAESPGRRPERVSVIGAGALGRAVDSPIVIRLRIASRIDMIVMDKTSSAPVVEAKVLTGDRLVASTDDVGHASFSNPATTRVSDIIVEAEGYARQYVTIRDADPAVSSHSAEDPVAVRMERERVVVGRVVMADGAQVPKFTHVYFQGLLASADGPLPVSAVAQVGEDGGFRIQGLSPSESYTRSESFAVSPDGRMTREAGSANPALRVELLLPPAEARRTINVTIRRADGEHLDDARIRVQWVNAEASAGVDSVRARATRQEFGGFRELRASGTSATFPIDVWDSDGCWLLSAWSRTCATDYAVVEAREAANRTELVLRPVAVVTGRISPCQSGVGGAVEVLAFRERGAARAITGTAASPDGEFMIRMRREEWGTRVALRVRARDGKENWVEQVSVPSEGIEILLR